MKFGKGFSRKDRYTDTERDQKESNKVSRTRIAPRNLDFPTMKQQEYDILKAINMFGVFFCLKQHFFTFLCRVRQKDKLFSISQFWGNLDFLQKSFITSTIGRPLTADS